MAWHRLPTTGDTLTVRYRVTNWEDLQHYKARNPPWIKLYGRLLNSRVWVLNDDATRVLLIACMVVASREDGVIDASEEGLRYLRLAANLNTEPDLTPLIESGFLAPDDESEHASKMLAPDASKMLAADAIPRREREETETETETENRIESMSDVPSDALAGLPTVAAFYPELRRLLKAAHPRARLPADGTKADAEERQAVARLVKREAYTEAEWVECMRWLFTSSDRDAEFWRGVVQAFKPLGVVKNGTTKMARIYSAWQKTGSSNGRFKFETGVKAGDELPF